MGGDCPPVVAVDAAGGGWGSGLSIPSLPEISFPEPILPNPPPSPQAGCGSTAIAD
jgi:hypothetical protein